MFNTDSPLCQTCNTEETIHHFLLQCQRHRTERNKMIRRLQQENIINPGTTELLGGGPYPEGLQNKIRAIVGTYLKETGRIKDL